MDSHDKRIVGRWLLPSPIFCNWNVRRRALRRRETYIEAEIIDLSVAGALVRTSRPDPRRRGDEVVLRSGDRHAVVKVRYTNSSHTEFGVEFQGRSQLRDELLDHLESVLPDGKDRRRYWHSRMP
ncbi:MAG: hypothetical protein RIB98_09680 [Acidimicrobiales bacterium]